MIYVTGPGHGGPGLVANTYLEGTYSEFYPKISAGRGRPEDDCSRSSRFPAAFPATSPRKRRVRSTKAANSAIRLAHAYGAAFDNPDLLVACVVGDGEAETGPLATSWHSNKFLNPVHDGAVLPILHLNGYKIANPTVLARISRRGTGTAVSRLRLQALFRGGRRSRRRCTNSWRQLSTRSSPRSERSRPRRAPQVSRKRPALADDHLPHAQRAGPDRRRWMACRPKAHGVRPPGAAGRIWPKNPSICKMLEQWMKSYRPEELFDENGKLIPELAELAPKGDRRMGANPHANGGLLSARS